MTATIAAKPAERPGRQRRMSKLLPRRQPKAVAVDSVRLLNSPSTCEDKIKPCKAMIIKYILPFLFLATLAAQEPIDQPAEILDPIAHEPPPPAAPRPVLKVEVPAENIIDSQTIVKDDQTIIVQQISPVELPPIPIPTEPTPPTPEQIAARAARIANAPKYRTLMLSCTVYDHQHTLITWTSQGKTPIEVFKAWSNVNFHYFNTIYRFKKNDTIYSFLHGIGDEDTAKAAARYARFGRTYTLPHIPTLPTDPATQPTYQIIQGNPTAEDIAPIKGLHEIYQRHHTTLIS